MTPSIGAVAGDANVDMTPASDDVVTIMNSMRRVVQALRTSTRASEATHGVTSAQLFVLRQLQGHPGMSLGEVAVRTRTSQSAVSEVVGRLIANGFVGRSPSTADRRRAELRLTPRGLAVASTAPETIQERLLAGLHDLDDERRRALADAMEAWSSAAGLADVAPTMFFEP
jgi:DNA-binding MarR family transcriptional regulator